MANRLVSPTDTKKQPPPIQPNAHPYAIKTTSTALLSRSNTSPHTPQHTRHHYIPLSNSRIPPGTRARHRHSSSLSSDEGDVRNEMHSVPSPLPTPPADHLTAHLKRKDASKPTHRARAGTMPSSATPVLHDRRPILDHDQDEPKAEPYTMPLNPKLWSTEELLTYLKSSDDVNGDEDDADLMDILECVRVRGFTGRDLLRLTDADLADTSLSDRQRTHLLDRSRTLRAEVLRGRISVDAYHSHEVSDNSNSVYSRYARTSTPFHSVRGASMSVDDLHSFVDNTDEGIFPPSPAITLHRSNSVSDVSAERYRDLARMRMRRRGRVKGLVETWERANTSGSECSGNEEGPAGTSDAESESEADPESPSALSAKYEPESPSDVSLVVHHEPLHDTASSVTDSAPILQEASSLPPPPPYTHSSTAREVVEEEEEPTVEELLASSSSIPLRGARAWEADFALGETVKRIPVSLSTDTDGVSSSVFNGLQSGHHSVRSRESIRQRNTSSRRKIAEDRKRVVTAIFTGSLTDEGSKDAGGAAQASSHDYSAHRTNDAPREGAPASSGFRNELDDGLGALAESIAATRAQMGAFKLRLERVEADTARQEAVLTQAQFPATLESRRQQSEAHEQLESVGDDTIVEDVRDRDVLAVLDTMSLTEIARAIVAKAMRWAFPYGHLARVPEEHESDGGYRPGENDKQSSAMNKSGGRLQQARASCSIILFSFAVCAAVLRRMGLGRWVRRP